jgi:hypothetical protein
LLSPSIAMSELMPTAAATAAISSGVKTRVIGWLTTRPEQDEDRRHEQGDLEARAERHRQRELHLVLGRELDGNEVFSEVADRRDDDDADEESRQPECGDERLDHADEDLRQDCEQGGGGYQDEDRDLRRPGRPGMALGLAMAAERLGRVVNWKIRDRP